MLTRILASFVRGKRAPTKGFWHLTSKRGSKTYYKGKGCIATGRHTSKGDTTCGCLSVVAISLSAGGYIISPLKKPRYIVPDLTNFELKPYVALNFRAPTKP